jgi:mono/diheme cytochrome c family protein
MLRCLVVLAALVAVSRDAAAQRRPDSLAVNQTEYQGWKLYHVNCDRCHGVDAVGSSFAPSLIRSVRGGITHDVFTRDVEDGIPDKGMPAWKGNLTPEQIESIWAYTNARASGGLASGRPHTSPQ